MSVSKTMNTAVTGLRAQQDAIGIVGDNIANSNTVGFKQSRALFEDILGNFSGARTVGAGGGAKMIRAQQIFSQGALKTTGVPSDLALSGDGFFVWSGAVDGFDGQYYSRDGSFFVNAEGTLVNSLGLKLQGYSEANGASFGGPIGDISVQPLTLPPKETSTVELVANLDSSATTFAAAGGANDFDPADPSNTSNFSTSVTVFDSQGNPHSLDVYFVRLNDGAVPPNATNDWEVHVLDGNTELTDGSPATPPKVSFDTAGKLISADAVTLTNVNWDPANPSPLTTNNLITFKVGNPTGAGGSGLDGLTQYGSVSSVSKQSQDGYTAASLTGLDVTADGTVNGIYSNSQKLALAQVAVAKFASNDGLSRSGHNLFSETLDSGQANLGAASSGGRGGIVSGAVEQSNVDLAAQFVDMIGFQRAFSANSKTITTADELLVETLNLKR
ncbi:MAG: flagellar hook protein FlgE [Deltaproteobacteria bacterium]|nr:flagellar hook protein FlgE [Deltaproteobacteria bacterium]